MKAFTDRQGRSWVASIREELGADYKGRYYLVFSSGEGPNGESYPLEDIRWNAERAARRSIQAMSVVELRRRLRSALGRGGAVAAGL